MLCFQGLLGRDEAVEISRGARDMESTRKGDDDDDITPKGSKKQRVDRDESLLCLKPSVLELELELADLCESDTGEEDAQGRNDDGDDDDEEDEASDGGDASTRSRHGAASSDAGVAPEAPRCTPPPPPTEGQTSGRNATDAAVDTQGKLIRGRASPGFTWPLPPEMLPRIALFLGWKVAGGTCSQVCSAWMHALRGDTLWKSFLETEFGASPVKFQQPPSGGRWGWGAGWGGLPGHADEETKMIRVFRDTKRRQVERSLGELRTGWEWVRERLRREECGEDELKRCGDVATKLANRDWVALYECLALLTSEVMEDLGGVLGSCWRASACKEGGLDMIKRMVGCWKRGKAWIGRVHRIFWRLNAYIDGENRKFDGQFGSCTSRLVHTPSVHQMGLIAFREKVVLVTVERAKRVQGAMTYLADEEARDLSDTLLETLMSFTSMCETLDVQDDHTGGKGGGGQARLRKLFLQPLRKIQCEKSFHSRSGKVRMFGGERDLLYGRFKEDEVECGGEEGGQGSEWMFQRYGR